MPPVGQRKEQHTVCPAVGGRHNHTLLADTLAGAVRGGGGDRWRFIIYGGLKKKYDSGSSILHLAAQAWAEGLGGGVVV